MNTSSPLLFIGLDAAEHTLVRQLIDDGRMPHLAKLLVDGQWMGLDSTAARYVGGGWSSFAAGQPDDEHGLYNYVTWSPEEMRQYRPDADEIELKPFWRELADRGHQVVALDMPMTADPGPDYPGIEACGWTTCEVMGDRFARPAEAKQQLTARLGRQGFDTSEVYFPMTTQHFLDTRDRMIRMADATTESMLELMQREKWDVAMAAYYACHQAGHKVGGLNSLRLEDREDPKAVEAVEDALVRVYEQIDAGIGRLVAEAGPEATVLVASVHGMSFNPCRNPILRDMLGRVLYGPPEDDGEDASPGLLQRLREMVPNDLRRQVKAALPVAVQDRLTLFWRVGDHDWPNTRAFMPLCDYQGYVQVNLKGREAEGIVEPGKEYDALCNEIIEGLMSFKDETTGRPLIEKIQRTDETGGGGPKQHLLPDLVIDWAKWPACEMTAAVSPEFGRVPWPTPGEHPDGRGGNHRAEGFAILPGSAGPWRERGHNTDFAATCFRLLGEPPLPGFKGQPLQAEAAAPVEA